MQKNKAEFFNVIVIPAKAALFYIFWSLVETTTTTDIFTLIMDSSFRRNDNRVKTKRRNNCSAFGL